MNKKIIILMIISILWTGVIFFLSEMNSQTSNEKSTRIVTKLVDKYDRTTHASSETILRHRSSAFIEKVNHIFRKICHASVYFVLAILILSLLFQINKRKMVTWYWSTFIFSSIYALVDEYHQTLVAGRTGQIMDVIIDLSGIGLGILTFFLFNKVFFKKRGVK